jgi:Lar family restriction alleviation protein
MISGAKPCPFCGRHAQLTLVCSMVPKQRSYRIECVRKCGAHGPYRFGEATAVRAWNRRWDPFVERPWG